MVECFLIAYLCGHQHDHLICASHALQADHSEATESTEVVQVFFARAPPGITDDKLKDVFSKYGQVKASVSHIDACCLIQCVGSR